MEQELSINNQKIFLSSKTGREYSFCRALDIPKTYEVSSQIAEVCSEPLIYDTLFQSMLNGQPYTASSAEGFMNYLHDGWVTNSHFDFLILDDNKKVIGTIGIKEKNLERAEIGYWSSEFHPGVMSKALSLLCQEAASLGFKSLLADVKKWNKRSIKVLENNDFTIDYDLTLAKPEYLVFTKVL